MSVSGIGASTGSLLKECLVGLPEAVWGRWFVGSANEIRDRDGAGKVVAFRNVRRESGFV